MRRLVEYAASVVIDLSDLRFIDAAGLQLFNELADGRDVIRFEQVDTRVTRTFEIAGLGGSCGRAGASRQLKVAGTAVVPSSMRSSSR